MSDGVKYRLTSWDGYTWSSQALMAYSPTYKLIADRLLMRFITQGMINTMVLTKVTVGVVLD